MLEPNQAPRAPIPSPTVQGIALEHALEEQRSKLHAKRDTLQVTADALQAQLDAGKVPPECYRYVVVLRDVARSLEDIAASLHAGALEEHAVRLAALQG